MHAERANQSGFTLVEVLVALVATALLMAIVLDGAATARERNRASLEKRAAVLLARSLLAQAAVDPWQKAPQTGSSNGLSWQVSERIEKTDRRGLFALVRIEARVANPKGRQLLAVDTLHLKPLAGS